MRHLKALSRPGGTEIPGKNMAAAFLPDRRSDETGKTAKACVTAGSMVQAADIVQGNRTIIR